MYAVCMVDFRVKSLRCRIKRFCTRSTYIESRIFVGNDKSSLLYSLVLRTCRYLETKHSVSIQEKQLVLL